jgi:hypothetical protein
MKTTVNLSFLDLGIFLVSTLRLWTYCLLGATFFTHLRLSFVLLEHLRTVSPILYVQVLVRNFFPLWTKFIRKIIKFSFRSFLFPSKNNFPWILCYFYPLKKVSVLNDIPLLPFLGEAFFCMFERKFPRYQASFFCFHSMKTTESPIR